MKVKVFQLMTEIRFFYTIFPRAPSSLKILIWKCEQEFKFKIVYYRFEIYTYVSLCVNVPLQNSSVFINKYCLVFNT